MPGRVALAGGFDLAWHSDDPILIEVGVVAAKLEPLVGPIGGRLIPAVRSNRARNWPLKIVKSRQKYLYSLSMRRFL